MIEQLDHILSIVNATLVALLVVPLAMTFWRMARGPGFADRFIAIDMLTGIAITLAALTADLTGRREFLDVAVGVALISFVATCAFAAFLERRL
ncbi:monovalent cation/H+ antiporter complex subunit F [Aureimonas altamirensis]|uniref:monovalent cation/H+ antiporter complex subunit F n=1 Tax=Aureimonas TaxID=414371 RepID=UPI0017830527|nr:MULTISPECIES: monovalent cation/H+ antiporter complex subunit F [Aureimonas]MCM2504241.1 monovalent cation/H+ antiporter complex subunit F [Aureimonas altamirensis]QOG05158.1 cation transporter [Aureimonas sp. OT7]